MTEPIVLAIQRYHPEWEPPPENPNPRAASGRWSRCRCPFHPDTVASAAVSYVFNAYSCLGCGVRGSPISIIQSQEEVSYREAIRIAEELSEGSDATVPPKPAGVSRRRVPGDSGSGVRQPAPRTRDQNTVPTRVRRRPPGWT